MEIEFLGTGTSQGVPVINCSCEVCQSKDSKDKRLRTSIHVRSANTHVIVDVGPDFRYQMLRTDVPRIDAALITHEHNDHVAGMDDLRPYNFLQREDIPIYACDRVVRELKTRFYYAFMEKTYPGAPGYDVRTIKHGDRFSIGDIDVLAFEVMHGNLPILCYRFNDVVYITDAKTISDSSVEMIKNCDTLIINCLRFEEHWSHLSFDEVLEWIEIIRPRKAYLTHMSHLIGKHQEISKLLPAHVFFAFDGLKLVDL